MRVRLFTEPDRERWNNYVLRLRSSSCYHLIGWKDVIEKSFNHRTYYLLAEEGDEVKGILPLVQLKSIFFGNFIVSLPYFNYGGICAGSDEIYGKLLNEAVGIAVDRKVSHVEFRHVGDTRNGLPARTEKVSMRLPLPGNPDELWDSFPSKLRSQVRRPEKEGMYAVFGKERELESFYDVFSSNMRDLGTPVYSREFFRNIMSTFNVAAWICTIYTRYGNPVASGFLLGFKDTLEIPWASSLRSYSRQSPNMLLYWSALKFACEHEYKVFDFGRSTRGVGTYLFKEQWGARPVQLYWNYWLKDGGDPPLLNPQNAKYRMAIKIWQQLPITLTKLIGPRIVKNLP